jgi:hypothetical protein
MTGMSGLSMPRTMDTLAGSKKQDKMASTVLGKQGSIFGTVPGGVESLLSATTLLGKAGMK